MYGSFSTSLHHISTVSQVLFGYPTACKLSTFLPFLGCTAYLISTLSMRGSQALPSWHDILVRHDMVLWHRRGLCILAISNTLMLLCFFVASYDTNCFILYLLAILKTCKICLIGLFFFMFLINYGQKSSRIQTSVGFSFFRAWYYKML